MGFRMSKMGIAAISLLMVAVALYELFRWAVMTHGPALLDWSDRQFGGNAGYRLALTDGRFGPLPAHKIEVIVPESPAERPRPVVVFFHGGGWNSGAPGDYRFIGRQLAREGYVVMLPGYRLNAEGRYPAMLEDGALALAWVKENAARFGGDPAQVILIGHSAGAYNAVMLALERQWLGRVGVEDGFVRGVIGLSGPYDFYPFTSDSARAAFGAVQDHSITQPVTFARGDAPPMMLLTGDKDETVKPRNSMALAKALSDAGAPTRPVIIAGLDHAGTIKLMAAPFNRDRRVIDPVLAFLAARCRPSAPVQAGGR